MAKTRSMTRNENHDNNASSKKRFNTCDNGWSDLNLDVLYLVMIRLGVVDFVGFSGVCKSWRSLALSNRKRFMATKPPMSICISNDDEKEGRLKDFEGRMFKTLLPHSSGRTCVGLTCGYLVFYGKKTHDLWLVNPITRHQIHFPALPCSADRWFKAILVYSPSMAGWAIVVSRKWDHSIWFSVADKGLWNHVASAFPILDLHAFKGKIYILNTSYRLCELRLDSNPKLTVLEIKNLRKPHLSCPMIVSSGENLYVMDDFFSLNSFHVHELDFGEMKWVLSEEKTTGKYAFFLCSFNYGAAFKPQSWADHWSQYKRYAYFFDVAGTSPKGRFFRTSMWYFPHECLNIDLINE